jgi:glycosyltransferase involved in cell wall biosynthesis
MPNTGKLTIAQANFHQLWGGQAEVVLSLATSLAAKGHRAIVIAPAGSELAKRAAAAGLEVFTGCRFNRGFRPGSFFSDARKLRAFLRENKVDIYHCHGSQDHWIGAFALRRSIATKIVRTRHNIYPVKNHVFNRWLFRKKTAQVIIIFSDQARFFTETGLLKKEQLFTLHSPLPQEFVDARDVTRVVRRELSLGDDVPVLGFAANFHRDKAPLDFLAACEKIAKTLPQAHFCMAGHGPLEAEVRARAEAAGLLPRFHLLGFRKDILQVMASYDCLALTSVTREASSTVLKQAAALGKPVVATDVGGTREVIEDSVTGMLVKPGDVDAIAAAATTLLSDRNQAAKMGAAGKEKVLREFTAQAIAERTEQLYREILRRG